MSYACTKLILRSIKSISVVQKKDMIHDYMIHIEKCLDGWSVVYRLQQRRIIEVKTMRMGSRMNNKYNPPNS